MSPELVGLINISFSPSVIVGSVLVLEIVQEKISLINLNPENPNLNPEKPNLNPENPNLNPEKPTQLWSTQPHPSN